MPTRCSWCGDDPLYQNYHDTEWGVACRDDQKLFEKLNLEGAQAGLSWITILKKRENYRKAFFNFDPQQIIQIDADYREQLLQNTGIVRNRLKIDSVISNAHAFLDFQQKHGSFSDFIWSFVDGKQQVNHWKLLSDGPTTTAISEDMSKQLKKLGFKFVGPTICYSFMQSMGLINDHVVDCFRHQPCIEQ